MRHFTCDKCGYPIETQNIITINGTKYDICVPCTSEMMKGLDGKGENPFNEIFRRAQEEKERKNLPPFGQGLGQGYTG